MSEYYCRFCGSKATVKVSLDQGCACYPLDREQYLCEQHWYKVEPIGSCQVIEELVWPEFSPALASEGSGN